MTQNALVFNKVEKSFGELKALKNISFTVEAGTFVALLGPNGAGKTTLINCLNGLTKRDGGEILVMGEDPEVNPLHTKMALGIVEQELVFDPFFTPLEMLRMRRGLFGLKPDEEYVNWLLDKLSLTDKKNVRARQLSGGMKRRLMIAKALAHKPTILILDEPTAGVDVELRNSLYEFLGELKKEGMTIVLTTHYIEEAQLLADKVAIQDAGETLIFESTKTLLGRKKKILELTNEDGEVVTLEEGEKGGFNLEKISADYPRAHNLRVIEPKLEDIFLEFTKKK
ncbi:ABC transporter ATP-binding protein [bacterium]|nr:ABC transporter ATP-binding protein [bacterium]NCQ55582.1 ABC transporter ATP-binding protein [Candidatus Parcubacteria bacterium]NCS67407.1 ABC transporter ATP-binding protein [Candidatus Peregrinibacteria bacterium]NCS96133.1 ABC transporter ATP-binding protein [bacterium]